MWIKYKVPADTPLEEIAKKFKNKDIKALLRYPKNKIAAAAHKKGKPVPKGTIVWLLDSKVTVYIMTTPKGKVVVSEKDWKVNIAKINKAMDFAIRKYKLTHETIEYRHKIQKDCFDEFPVISFFCSNWYGDKGDEPKSEKTKSAAAVKTLAAVVKGRNYKQFEVACKNAEKRINAYAVAMDNWITQMTGSAENWEILLTYTRDGGFIIFGACAMTVAAPATMAGTLAYGAAVGAGTAFMSSGANEAGRHWAGADNVTFKSSLKQVSWDMFKGAAFGAAGAGAARLIAGVMLPKLAEKLASSQVANKLTAQLFKGSKLLPNLSRRLFEREVGTLIKAGGEGTVYLGQAALDKMMAVVTVKLISRLGSATISKCLQEWVKGEGSKWVELDLQKQALKMRGKMNEAQIGEQVADRMVKDPIALKAFEAIVKSQVKKIEEAFKVELKKELERQQKAAKK